MIGRRRKVLVTRSPGAMEAMAPHYREHGEHLVALLRRRDPDELRVLAAFFAELAP